MTEKDLWHRSSIFSLLFHLISLLFPSPSPLKTNYNLNLFLPGRDNLGNNTKSHCGKVSWFHSKSHSQHYFSCSWKVKETDIIDKKSEGYPLRFVGTHGPGIGFGDIVKLMPRFTAWRKGSLRNRKGSQHAVTVSTDVSVLTRPAIQFWMRCFFNDTLSF